MTQHLSFAACLRSSMHIQCRRHGNEGFRDLQGLELTDLSESTAAR